ncbi:MAG: hypothetical protein HYV63_27335 [Candidatus Schekmanbacteria bacterium]|nr:hypothetical protein [Candidatus Schekmanbacteria bacterium]
MTNHGILAIVVASVLVGTGSAAGALDTSARGELGVEGRVFTTDTDDRTDDYNVAVSGRVDVTASGAAVRAKMRLFGRYDAVDGERTVLVPEEVWLEWRSERFRLRAGHQLLNWTATEAFHPADVINSRLFDSAIENPDKFGEPMVSARAQLGDGNVELMFMPVFTKPKGPSASSRLRLAAPGLAVDRTIHTDDDGQVDDDTFVPQWALRAQQTFGSADVSLHAVRHIDRDAPVIYYDPERAEVIALFQPLTQLGGTLQMASGSVVLKLEAAYRMFEPPSGTIPYLPPVPDRDYGLVAAGVEYGLVHASGAGSTLLCEAQAALDYPHEADRLAPLFQRDLLLGYRFAFNDEDEKSLVVLVIDDLERSEHFMLTGRYSQRLGERWGIKAGFQWLHFPARDPAMPLGFEWLDDADHIHASLFRYF